MKRIPLLLATILCATISANAQQSLSSNKSNESSVASGDIHPQAKRVLKNKFYWDKNDPNSPFVSNYVANTFKVFELWRQQHTQESPVNFLPKYQTSQMALYRNETDLNKIETIYTDLYNTQKQFIARNSDWLLQIELAPKGVNKATQEQKDAILEKAVRETSYTLLCEEDDLIISIGFGQFALEGKIDEELKTLTKKALIRQLNPFVLSVHPDEGNRALRESDLAMMLQDLKSLN